MWIAGLPALWVGRWKQTNMVEATHLPFVQVLIGFTRPERGIINQRSTRSRWDRGFTAVLLFFPEVS